MPKSNSFLGNVLKIMGGTAFGQTLGIITLPIITRLFAPEAFGLLGVYGAITGILSVVVCMRYELTIVIPKEDNEAAHLYWVSFGFTLFWTAVSAVAVLFFAGQIANLVNAPELASFLWMVPIGVLIKGIHTSNSHWNTRRAQFGRLASVQISNSVVTSGSKIGLGLAGLTSGGYLIAGSLTGTFTASIELGRKIWMEDRKLIISKITRSNLVKVIKRYKNISIFNTSASLFHSFSTSAPLILLAYFFNPAIVGFYILGHKLLKIPVNLIGASIKTVFFQRAADEYNEKGNLVNITEFVGNKLALLSIIFTTIMISTIAPLTPLIFGEEWVVAGEFMQWMAIWIGVSFIVNPLRSISTVLQQEDKELYFQIFAFILRLIALLIGGLIIRDAYITVILYSIASLIYLFLFFIWILDLAGASIVNVFYKLKNLTLLSIIVILTSMFLQMMYNNILIIAIINILYICISILITKSIWVCFIDKYNKW